MLPISLILSNPKNLKQANWSFCLQISSLQNRHYSLTLQHCHVCSDHFETSCFKGDLKAKLLQGQNTKREVKDGAVPSLLPHKKKACRRLANERWRNRALHAEVSLYFELQLYSFILSQFDINNVLILFQSAK